MTSIFSVPISQKRKCRHREVEQLARGHTASKWQSRATNPGLPDNKIFLLSPGFFRCGVWSFGPELSRVLVKIKDPWNGRLWDCDMGIYPKYPHGVPMVSLSEEQGPKQQTMPTDGNPLLALPVRTPGQGFHARSSAVSSVTGTPLPPGN